MCERGVVACVCVVRNPWDVMVSLYFGKRITDMSFDRQQFNWNMITIRNRPVCDFYIRYENLHKDIAKVCQKIGIKKFDCNELPAYKSHHRKYKKHYSHYYNDKTRARVAKIFKQYIKFFGYKFENKNITLLIIL